MILNDRLTCAGCGPEYRPLWTVASRTAGVPTGPATEALPGVASVPRDAGVRKPSAPGRWRTHGPTSRPDGDGNPDVDDVASAPPARPVRPWLRGDPAVSYPARGADRGRPHHAEPSTAAFGPGSGGFLLAVRARRAQLRRLGVDTVPVDPQRAARFATVDPQRAERRRHRGMAASTVDRSAAVLDGVSGPVDPTIRWPARSPGSCRPAPEHARREARRPPGAGE